MSLGQALRRLRKQKGLTLAELADRTDSYVGNLSRIERNVAKPSLDLLYRVADALDSTMADIFSISEASGTQRDPRQVALNTFFISLPEQDRELLVSFAELLQAHSRKALSNISVDAKPLPVTHEPEPGEPDTHPTDEGRKNAN
ncbi:helix-turn-helix domain-containing protein [Marinobacter koreensis]|uniref:Helix-turn-helix domain-containing protein n=1 Tax=Marinobacter koreensis TaxID=335974 RepID=A0ABW0RR50_9GAMM|nr:helix-turn-helix transcriptional regulator [Marinobacter koreensis]MCK7548766.1 helix-turn-helix transcriptional regulator [Marinobacter koreensis]